MAKKKAVKKTKPAKAKPAKKTKTAKKSKAAKKAKPTKKVAKRKAAKKTAAKKSAVKKAAPRKAAARKSAPKKAAARKAPVKKAAARESAPSRPEVATIGRAAPDVVDVDVKKYKFKEKAKKVKITGANLRGGMPSFKSINPAGVTWTLEDIDNMNHDDKMFVDATPSHTRNLTGPRDFNETGDLVVTVDSGGMIDSETFVIEFEPEDSQEPTA